MNYSSLFIHYCQTLDVKLTSLRKMVLFVLWQVAKPLKAYEILDRLLADKQHVQAPTVYRVLDYFVEHGVVHKIESIQSYTLCHEPEKQRAAEVLMVCNDCHQVQELYDSNLHNLMKKLTTQQDFQLGQNAIELKGICNHCVDCAHP